MPTAILFFLPTTSPDSSPLPDFVNRLTSQYNPSILPRWSLRHRLFRSTPEPTVPSNGDEIKSYPTRYLQVLTLPDYPNDSLIAITPASNASTTESSTVTDPAASVVAIPSGSSTDGFIQLLLTKLGPLWQQRQLTAVVDGLAFDIGDFRVRAGELRQGVGGAQLVRGVVIEVAHMDGVDAGQDSADMEDLIMTFWAELSVKGAKVFSKKELTYQEDGFVNVRLWSKMLMLRN
ncbi:MAG: hypothetical protein Q9220_006657 [cf. Caloplaca sp. 1 TL-2023]